MKKLSFLIILTFSLCVNKLHAQWQPLNGPVGGQIICSAVGGLNIYVGTALGGVFRSGDSGNSWKQVNTGFANSYISDLAVMGNTVLAISAGGLYQSYNNGDSWTLSDSNQQGYAGPITISGTNIFVKTMYGGMLLSPDSGKSWTNTNLTPPAQPVFNGLPENITAYLYVGTNVFVATGDSGIFVSPVGDSSWLPVRAGLPMVSGFSVRYWPVNTIFSFGNTIFAGTDNGLYTSDNDGQSWAPNNSIGATSVYSLAVSDTTIFALAENQGAFVSSTNGNSWIPANKGLPANNLISLTASQNNVFVATGDSGVYVTSNNGALWAPANNGFGSYMFTQWALGGGSVMATCGNQVFTASENRLYSSNNNGGLWNVVDSIAQRWPMVDVAASGNYVVVENSPYSCDDDYYTFWISTDSGNTWGPDMYGPPIMNGPFVEDDLTPNISIAGSGPSLFVSLWNQALYWSMDYGNTWTIFADDLPAHFTPLLYAIDTNIIASDEDHLLMWTSNGSPWTDIGAGLPFPLGINAYAVCGDYLFIGTNGGGVWKRPLTEIIPGYINKYGNTTLTSNISKDSASQTVVKLYPNPASSRLYIETGATITDITMFNSVGSTVFETNQDISNGIDISYLPKGVYVTEIKTNNVVVNQKWVKM